MGNNNSTIPINQEADVSFTSEETDKESGTILWLQNQLLDLNQTNFFSIVDLIVQSFDLKSELNIHQFIYNIILFYRMRPEKSDLYTNLVVEICEKLEGDSANFKRLFLRYMLQTFNMTDPNISNPPYLSLLFRCYKKGIYTISEILDQIEYDFTNYIEFFGYLGVLLCWFYPELKVEKPEIFKSLLKMYANKNDHWLFPQCIKESINIMSEITKTINDQSDEEAKNECSLELSKIRETGFLTNSIFEIIKNDDINSFEKIAASPSFNPDIEMKETVFIPYPILHYNPTLIQVAAYFGSIKIFKFLLLNKANIEYIDRTNMSLIHFAIAGGNTEIIRILDQNDVSFVGTPQIAAQYHRHDILEWLIDTKFHDISLLDPKFGSIAHNAAISNNLYVFNYLQTQGNDTEDQVQNNENKWIDAPNSKGLTPLHYAVSNGCFDTVYYLISTNKADVNKTDSDLDTPLHIASYSGYSAVLRFLLITGPKSVLLKNKKGLNPIQIATMNGHDHILQTLLKRKDIDINMTNDDGKTLLHLAVERGHSECLKVILSHQGVFISAHDNEGRTPLHDAAFKDHYECVKILLERKGIDINSCDTKFRTPLHDALRYSSTKTIKLLLKQPQIDYNAYDHEGVLFLN
ncbi:hypothetical protein M9Y10_034810 [Tritrichomonas musculus]|uniref:DUF3447 domain-containing protein n=1 Tax=Tritrichomonas musculus TaxID=1915356 RepID=A0ABR2KFZ6_9EUKA